jgi:hypothetical protein
MEKETEEEMVGKGTTETNKLNSVLNPVPSDHDGTGLLRRVY